MKTKINLSFNSKMEIDLSEIKDKVLFEELEERGYEVIEEGTKELIEDIYIANINDLNDKKLIKDLIYNTIGRIL